MIALFDDRAHAGRLLAERFAQRLAGAPLIRPLVLAIPRGGIEVAAPLARALQAELDVVLSRKLGAPGQPELALGAVSESGEVSLNEHGRLVVESDPALIDDEVREQMQEIQRRQSLVRQVRPAAEVAGRSVIVVDDGLATGSTMIAALRSLRARGPRELIVAVPVAPPDRLAAVRPLCDSVVCLDTPRNFWAVGQFYRDFEQVSDDRVVELLAQHPRSRATS